VKEEEEPDEKMEQKEREKEEKIKSGEKIEEEKEESNYICFFHFFIVNFSLDSLQPNKFTTFTSFDPEKDYWYPIYKEIQLSNTLENLYYSFGRFYFRYRPDIFDDRIRFLLNNSSLSRPIILLLPEMNESFLTEKELNQHNYFKSFIN
jgi:integrase